MKIKLKVIFLVVLIMTISSIAYAIDKTSTYRGILLTSGGTIVNTSINITFRIYDVSTGGTAIWSEVQNVQVSNGVFNVHLGEITPFPSTLFDKESLYIGVQVGIDSEMSPRQPMTTEGYVFHAKQ